MVAEFLLTSFILYTQHDDYKLSGEAVLIKYLLSEIIQF